MATSGQVNTNTLYDSYFWVKWSQKGNQDISNNQTTIDWSVGVYCGHSFYSNAIKMSPVSIDGAQVYGGGTYSNFSSGNHTIASGTKVITHNSDGSKKFRVAAFTGWLYSSYNYSSSGEDFDLTTIPRISAPTLSVGTLDFGKAVTIYTNRKSTNFLHKLWYKYGNTGWIEITPTASVTDNYSWTIPLTLMNQIPNASSLDITIGCDTYYNNSFIGEDYAYIKVTVPDTILPVIGNIVWTKSSSEPSSWPMTQNVSQGTMTMTGVEGKYGSTIVSQSLSFAGLSSNTASLEVSNIASEGTLKAVAKVVDSRGRPAVKEVDFIVAAYSKPQLSVSAFRSNGSGGEDPMGEYLCVTATVGITAIGDNSIKSVTLQYKQRSASSYTSVALTSGTSKVVAASSDYTWDWIVSASDKVSTVSINGSISTGDVILDIKANGKGIGLGKVAEKDGLDSAWDFMKNGITQVDYVIEQGTNGIWTYRKWASGIAECWGLYSLTGVEISAPWGYLYETAVEYHVQFPSGLFTSNPVAHFSTPKSTGGILAIETMGETTKIQTCGLFPVRATPQTMDLTIAIQAIGRWK